MLLLVVISSLLSQVLGEPLVGGEPSFIDHHPWLASVQKNGNHMCGGSIISESVILTAAHCVSGHPAESLRVRVGSSRIDSGGSYLEVLATRQHEHYLKNNSDPIKLRNDVALIRVTPPLVFGKQVARIELAERQAGAAPGDLVVLAGWGAERVDGPASPELKNITLHIRSSATCARAYGDLTGTQIRSNNLICATEYGPPGFCYGDSGSPLVTPDHRQVGIVSYYFSCDNPWFPGVYADVARYRDWIDANANALQEFQPQNSLVSKIKNIFKW